MTEMTFRQYLEKKRDKIKCRPGKCNKCCYDHCGGKNKKKKICNWHEKTQIGQKTRQVELFAPGGIQWKYLNIAWLVLLK